MFFRRRARSGGGLPEAGYGTSLNGPTKKRLRKSGYRQWWRGESREKGDTVDGEGMERVAA